MFDVLGVGCGPFNLSIAALLNSHTIRKVFFDKQKEYEWHSGMQLSFATIQNSHIRDLVSLVEPTSEYSFNNFLYQTGRLEAHTIANFQYIMRWEFEQYLIWVAQQLNYLKFDCMVQKIYATPNGFDAEILENGKIGKVSAKNLVIGVGVSPIIPTFAFPFLGDKVFHNSLYQFKSKQKARNIVIVGAGQSALEVCIDLFENYENIETITIIHKEPFIGQIEDSQFAEDKIFTSNGLNQFFAVPTNRKLDLLGKYRLTSDGASPHTVKQLYQILYKNHYLHNDLIKFSILDNHEVCDMNFDVNQNIDIKVKNLLLDNCLEVNADMVILASGYEQKFPKELFDNNILKNIEFNDEKPIIDLDYSVKYSGIGKLYVTNGSKHIHGVVDPNLSLNAIRAQKIINSILLDKKKEIQQWNLGGNK